MTEADLQSLGIHRIPVPVPFVEAGGPVNVYAVEDEGGGLALFDSGLGSDAGQRALAEGFARLGRSFAEVTRIVLSHGHVDHYGAAAFVAERAGRPVPVLVHPDDAPKVADWGPRWRELAPAYGAFFAKLGVPAEVLSRMAAEVGGGFTFARRIPDVRPLVPGTTLRFARLEAEVLHMPGHTPGLCCLWDAGHGLFFAADHLLEKVSPNPIVQLGPQGEEGFFRPLVTYLESIARLRALDVDLVLPGHGPPFGEHRRVIDSLLGFYAERQRKIRDLVAAAPRTGYEVVRALFPWAAPKHLFLVMSETIANLEVLEARGEVRREVDGGLYSFRLAG
jgi:glyoxylase-like metal-dependent hydrolase (beta-lactamase superfamily II)